MWRKTKELNYVCEANYVDHISATFIDSLNKMSREIVCLCVSARAHALVCLCAVKREREWKRRRRKKEATRNDKFIRRTIRNGRYRNFEYLFCPIVCCWCCCCLSYVPCPIHWQRQTFACVVYVWFGVCLCHPTISLCVYCRVEVRGLPARLLVRSVRFDVLDRKAACTRVHTNSKIYKSHFVRLSQFRIQSVHLKRTQRYTDRYDRSATISYRFFSVCVLLRRSNNCHCCRKRIHSPIKSYEIARTVTRIVLWIQYWSRGN